MFDIKLCQVFSKLSCFYLRVIKHVLYQIGHELSWILLDFPSFIKFLNYFEAVINGLILIASLF